MSAIRLGYGAAEFFLSDISQQVLGEHYLKTLHPSDEHVARIVVYLRLSLEDRCLRETTVVISVRVL